MHTQLVGVLNGDKLHCNSPAFGTCRLQLSSASKDRSAAYFSGPDSNQVPRARKDKSYFYEAEEKTTNATWLNFTAAAVHLQTAQTCRSSWSITHFSSRIHRTVRQISSQKFSPASGSDQHFAAQNRVRITSAFSKVKIKIVGKPAHGRDHQP
jgi:hypothetical protein